MMDFHYDVYYRSGYNLDFSIIYIRSTLYDAFDLLCIGRYGICVYFRIQIIDMDYYFIEGL